MANDPEIIAGTPPPPARLSYASPGTWSRSHRSIEWRTDDRALTLIVPGPPKWIDVVLASIALAAELATIAMTLAIIWQQYMEWRATSMLVAVSVAAACGWWTSVLMQRALRGDERNASIRVDVLGIEVRRHDGRSWQWVRSQIVDLRCKMVGAARGIREYLKVEVALKDDRYESAILPWPAGIGSGDVEPRLREALGFAEAEPGNDNSG